MTPFPLRATAKRRGPFHIKLVFCLFILGIAATFVFVAAIKAADSSALWKIVHDKCVVDQKTNQRPQPCETVDLTDGEANGSAVLKDLIGATQFLLIPTRRIAGIESPDLLAPGAPNYWRAAWAARQFVFKRAGHELPRDAIGLAINSAVARSQDQLHIHIDCVFPEVRDRIGQHIDEIGDNWSASTSELKGRKYSARRLLSTDLQGADPFKILADGIEAAGADMALETLVVIGARFAPDQDGFVLLADKADLSGSDRPHGENLLDHSCAIGQMPR
jgi:CDP-diacylglycerol pyrophosphatase